MLLLALGGVLNFFPCPSVSYLPAGIEQGHADLAFLEDWWTFSFLMTFLNND